MRRTCRNQPSGRAASVHRLRPGTGLLAEPPAQRRRHQVAVNGAVDRTHAGCWPVAANRVDRRKCDCTTICSPSARTSCGWTRTRDLMAQPDRRRAPRAALRLSATIREPGRSRTGVRIIDMSTHGCQIEATASASPDAWVLLSIAGIETQYCRIVWRINEFAGLEFASPIAEAVLQRLLQDQQLGEASIKRIARHRQPHAQPVGQAWRGGLRRPLGRSVAQLRARCGGRGIEADPTRRRRAASATRLAARPYGCQLDFPFRICPIPPSAWIRSTSEPRGKSFFSAQASTASS